MNQESISKVVVMTALNQVYIAVEPKQHQTKDGSENLFETLTCLQFLSFYHSLRKECQDLCDESDYCFAWSRGKSGNDNQVCTLKTLDKWEPLANSLYDSGFKGRSPFVETSSRLQPMPNGDGDFICDGETLPH